MDDEVELFLSIFEMNLRHASQLCALNFLLICDADVVCTLQMSQTVAVGTVGALVAVVVVLATTAFAPRRAPLPMIPVGVVVAAAVAALAAVVVVVVGEVPPLPTVVAAAPPNGLNSRLEALGSNDIREFVDADAGNENGPKGMLSDDSTVPDDKVEILSLGCRSTNWLR